MTDTPLDLDAIEARAYAAAPLPWSPLFADLDGEYVPLSWWMAYDDPEDPHGRFDWPQIQADAEFIAHARTDVPALVAALRKAEAQVAAVLALHTRGRDRYTEPNGGGLFYECDGCDDDWPCVTVRASLDAAGADVPMSPNTGHDLRERIAQRIDQAWAEANDQRPRSEYRDGYLDGLEHAEGIARSTPLTEGGAS